MTDFIGWAFLLNGVMVTGNDECSGNQAIWDAYDCFDAIMLERLTEPPDGLGIPDKKTQDTEFSQRDGVVHGSDWYLPRFPTFKVTLGPWDNAYGDVRKQYGALMEAWEKTCCDTELVVFTPMNGNYELRDPYLGDLILRKNLAENPSGAIGDIGWHELMANVVRSYDRRYDDAAADPIYTWGYESEATGDFTFERRDDGEGHSGNEYFRLTCVTPGDPDDPVPGIGFGGNDSDPRFHTPETEFAGKYTFSGYVRSSIDRNVVLIVQWLDVDGDFVGVSTSVPTENTANEWDRVSLTVERPDLAAFAQVRFATQFNDFGVGDWLDVDDLLVEFTDELRDYFDGDDPDVDPGIAGSAKIENIWTEEEQDSPSIQFYQQYMEHRDRSYYGPYGIVGRPRVASSKWRSLPSGMQVVDILLRFDSIDHRLYILDSCGTPGAQKCRIMLPGLASTSRSYDLEYPAGLDSPGRSYTEESLETSVPATTLAVAGNQSVHPLIQLIGPLHYPTITNKDTGQSLTYNGVIAAEEEPIIINTEDGTAFQGETSMSHKLMGSMMMEVFPGNTDFTLISQDEDDTGTVQLCWRDHVVAA